jgi:hypothetical protein
MMNRLRALALVSLVATPLLLGAAGSRSFPVAPLRPAGENFSPGTWVESSTVSSKDEITVVLMASWCPICAGLIDELAASPRSQGKLDMVVFFDDENGDEAKQGRFIQHPDKLAGRDLPYYFAKSKDFDGLYLGFPTILGCSESGCTPRDRTAIGLD